MNFTYNGFECNPSPIDCAIAATNPDKRSVACCEYATSVNYGYDYGYGYWPSNYVVVNGASNYRRNTGWGGGYHHGGYHGGGAYHPGGYIGGGGGYHPGGGGGGYHPGGGGGGGRGGGGGGGRGGSGGGHR